MEKKRTREAVHLRRRQTASGKVSLYLDIVRDGKRKYEFLKLYLVPERTKGDKERNAETLRLAEAVRAERIVQIERGAYGMEASSRSDKVRFFDYYDDYAKTRTTNGTSTYRPTRQHLLDYAKNEGVLLSDIDRAWCKGFVRYLDGLTLKDNTLVSYFSCLNAVLNQAVKDELIDRNPAHGVSTFRNKDAERNFLTIDELRQLAATPCRSEEVRRMFLFSCLTGLRYSDVTALRWSDVSKIGNFTRITFRQQKTRQQEYIDIAPEAVTLMGERTDRHSLVFNPPSRTHIYMIINEWVAAAQIGKRISFHCARHTFAVMMLDIGTDIYTVSKLLGHRELATTQIYAKILDKNKQKAVSKIPNIL